MNNEKQQSITFNGTWKPPSNQQNADRNHRRNQQDQELFCACNGLKCKGICRELHLYRKRTANPVVKKGTKEKPVGKQSWTNPPNQCPEAYMQPRKN